MTTFLAQSNKGNLSLGSAYNRARFADFLKRNDGIRLRIAPETPESKKQRGYFEGCLVRLATYYQEKMDHRNAEDCHKMREWIKSECLGELVVVNGKVNKITKSSLGGKNLRIATDFAFDWLIENYAPPNEALNPDRYKHWRDTIFSSGVGPDNYIDYLIEIKILK